MTRTSFLKIMKSFLMTRILPLSHFLDYFGNVYYIISISIEEQVFLALAYKATNVSAIAREMGMSRRNLYRKISSNTLKKEELCKIGKILGGQYVSYFTFPGGVMIGDKTKSRGRKVGSGKFTILDIK